MTAAVPEQEDDGGGGGGGGSDGGGGIDDKQSQQGAAGGKRRRGNAEAKASGAGTGDSLTKDAESRAQDEVSLMRNNNNSCSGERASSMLRFANQRYRRPPNGPVKFRFFNQKRCAECKLALARSRHIVNIGGHPGCWHADCFKCAMCRDPMDKRQSCHVYQGQVICRNDYLRLKRDQAVHCARCRWPIAASDWVRRAASHVYHIACFNCDICLRQLNTGEQFVIDTQAAPVGAPDQPSPSAGGAEVIGERVRLLCRLHFSVEPAAPAEALDCTARGSSIGVRPAFGRDQRHGTIGDERQARRQRYRKSLCSGNRRQQQQQQQFAQSNLQNALNAPNPSAPSTPSPASQQVGGENFEDSPMLLAQSKQRASLFQQDGLSCTDFDNQPLGAVTSAACASSANLSSSSSTTSSTTSSTSSSSSSSSAASTMSLQANNTSPMTPTGGSQTSSGLPCKSKRVRTTFTEDQLSILQTHFQIDSNPDGQDLERIATITGLSKRVTQVWFQNSRARQKKYMIKRKPMSGTANLALAASFNMGAAAPGASPASGSQQQQQQQLQLQPHPQPPQEQASFRMAVFGEDNVFGAPPVGRELLTGGSSRTDDTAGSGWQMLGQDPGPASSAPKGNISGDNEMSGKRESLRDEKRDQGSRSSLDDDESDRCSLAADKEDQRAIASE